MSWDVALVKTETNNEDISAIVKPIPFTRKAFIETVKQGFPDTNCNDETWLILDRPTFAIEFNIGRKELADSVMLHIRGGEEPTEVILYLCAKLDCRAFDCSSGEFIEMGKETAFKEWKQYRDKVIGQTEDKS